jgi:hypothetical protein
MRIIAWHFSALVLSLWLVVAYTLYASASVPRPPSLTAQAESVLVGEPFRIAWDHDGANLTDFVVLRDGSEIAVLPGAIRELPATHIQTLSAGQHTYQVIARGRDADGAITVSGPATLLITATAVQTCSGADALSVFVTRWEMTTGNPGSRMRVNYQLASASPVTRIEAKINGAVVAFAEGADLRETAGLWLTTPAPGVYKLQVFARNAAGCTRESFSLIDLQVK